MKRAIRAFTEFPTSGNIPAMDWKGVSCRRGFDLRAGLCVLALHAAALSAPPNIVYLLADDMGLGDVSGFNPASKVATPAMDGLIREGMRFTDAHSGSAVCTPTRYGILTGRYCWRSRLKNGVLGANSPHLIETGRLTVASLLKQRGYATACVGKWHLGLDWKDADDWGQGFTNGPRSVGFDYFYGISASLDMDAYAYLEGNMPVMVPTNTIAASPWPAFWRGGKIAPGFRHEDVLPRITSKATAWLAQRKASPSQPFFLYLPLPSPHTPHVPAADFIGRSQAGVRGDYVAETDWAMGQVIKALDSLGLSANTLVVATADNGANDHTYRQFGHTPHMGFRGEKADIFEAGHRVPFIVRWPGVVKANSLSAETVCLTDLMATAAAIVSARLPDSAGEDSYSLLPILLGTPRSGPLRQATVHHSIDGTFAIRQGDWKLTLDNMGSGGFTEPATVAGPGTLFNMVSNPEEDPMKDQYANRPAAVAELRALLAKYQTDGRSVALPRVDAFWKDPTVSPGRPLTLPLPLRLGGYGESLYLTGVGPGPFRASWRTSQGRVVWTGTLLSAQGRAVLPKPFGKSGLWVFEAEGLAWSGHTLWFAD